MSNNNGGSAFPLPELTLRDYFAAKAMQGLLPARDPQGRSAYTEMTAEQCANSAYKLADAMLKAREVRNE